MRGGGLPRPVIWCGNDMGYSIHSCNHGITELDPLYDHQPQPCLSDIPVGEFALFRVGDCISMHNIHGAIYDSLRIAKDF